MPGEFIIAHNFNPEVIFLSSPSTILVQIFNTLGYSSQLFFRLYLKFFKNNEESNELLQWYLVIILGIAYVIPTFSILLGMSIYWTLCVILILQFVLIPGMILLCHENAHQYYFSNHPKLHRVVLYLKHASDKFFYICLSQSQPQEPSLNLHEPVIDDMVQESNLQVIAIQAASRLELAQQAVQEQQTQNLQVQSTSFDVTKSTRKNLQAKGSKAHVP